MSGWGGGGGWWNQLSTFDAEFKFAKIQNSYVRWSSNLLKKKKKKFFFLRKIF